MTTDLKCLVTGVDIYVRWRDYHYHGDLHRMGGAFVFNAVMDPKRGEARKIENGFGLSSLDSAQMLETLDGVAAAFVEEEDIWDRRGIFIFGRCIMNEAAKRRSANVRDIGGWMCWMPNQQAVGPIYDPRIVSHVCAHGRGDYYTLRAPDDYLREEKLPPVDR